MSTLTIRINADLKSDIMAIAHHSGEDASSWIRRFFERIRADAGRKKIDRRCLGDDDGVFSQEFIQSVLEAKKSGSFQTFDLQKYV